MSVDSRERRTNRLVGQLLDLVGGELGLVINDRVVGGPGVFVETRVGLKVEVAMEDGRNSLVDDGTSGEVLHASDEGQSAR